MIDSAAESSLIRNAVVEFLDEDDAQGVHCGDLALATPRALLQRRRTRAPVVAIFALATAMGRCQCSVPAELEISSISARWQRRCRGGRQAVSTMRAGWRAAAVLRH